MPSILHLVHVTAKFLYFYSFAAGGLFFYDFFYHYSQNYFHKSRLQFPAIFLANFRAAASCPCCNFFVQFKLLFVFTVFQLLFRSIFPTTSLYFRKIFSFFFFLPDYISFAIVCNFILIYVVFFIFMCPTLIDICICICWPLSICTLYSLSCQPYIFVYV